MAEADEFYERRTPPSKVVMERRMMAANGKPPEQAFDTIGKLWCFDLLDGESIDADVLRDAGRFYAMLYWHRYGNVAPKTGAYEMFMGQRGRGGRPGTIIVDESADLAAEEMFAARDAALQRRGWLIRKTVNAFCVDGAGDNDPNWLNELVTGFPTQTEALRKAVAEAREARRKARGRTPRREASEKLARAERELSAYIAALRCAQVPTAQIDHLRVGLVDLARIYISEGWTRRNARTI